MRIAQVIESCGGGTGRHVVDLSRALVARGHSVTVIYSPRRAERQFVEMLQAVDGLRMVELPFERSIGLHDFTHAKALEALLRERGPFEIVHGHSSKAGALIRLVSRRVAGARFYSPHAIRTMDPTLSQKKRVFYSIVERILGYRDAFMIAGSVDEVQALRRVGIPKRKIGLVRFGIELDRRIPRKVAREELDLPNGDTVIGFVGRLVWQKAPERAIQALAEMKNRSATLAIVGGGEQDELKALAVSLGVGDRVKFLGFKDGSRAMNAFDTLVVPSRYDSSPYVLLECLQAGIPFVSTDVGMASELISEAPVGAAVANTDEPGPLADALDTVLEPANYRARLSSVERFRESISIEKMVAQVEALYRQEASTSKLETNVLEAPAAPIGDTVQVKRN